MKKILLFMLCMILLVGTVSASDWDNTLAYSENDLKVTLRNSILWIIPTSEIGTIELKSHSFVDEIIEVGAGNQVPMFYDFEDWKEIYLNGLGGVYFTDMRTGEKIDRDYSFVYWGEKERDIYGCNYVYSVNGTKTCERVIVGKEVYEDWLPYNSLDIPKGNIRIGLMTYVEVNDKIDGVWTIAGKKIKKHSTWIASLNVDLELYYDFEDAEEKVVGVLDFQANEGTMNYTENGALIGKSGRFTANNNLYIASSSSTNIRDSEGTLNFWVYVDSVGGPDDYVISNYGDANFNHVARNDGVWYSLGFIDGTAKTGPALLSANWIMVTYLHNSSGAYIYINGTLEHAGAITTTNLGDDSYKFGSTNTDTDDLVGYMDEKGWWSRPLSHEEISVQLWNDGAGISYTTGLRATLLFPEDTANFTTNAINFSADIIDDSSLGIQNVTLEVIYPNGTLFYDETNVSGFEGFYNWTDINIPDGNWNWSVSAYDDNNKSYESIMRVFTIDTTPFIQFEDPTPINYYNSTNSYVPINISLTETYFDNITFSFYNDTLTEFYYEDNTRFINESFAEGIYNYNVTTWTTTGQTNSTETRNITIDTTNPVITSNSSITFDFQEVNTNLTIYFNITEPNPDTCFADYNGTNISIGCGNTSVIINTTTLTNRNIIFYANDTFGHETIFDVAWNYTVFENSQTFNNETFEGIVNTFIANVTIIESNSITIANLIYNGTSYSNSFSQSGNDSILTIDFLAPNVDTNTNLTFFWSLTLLDGQIINLTSHNQTVIALSLDDCSVNTVILYNYTVVDEKNQSILSNPFNTTTELNINLLDITRQNYIVNFSKKYLKINPFTVCINKNLSSSTYLVDSVVKYEAVGYSIEYYNIINSTITNSTIPVNITLYDLFSADATEFKITFKAEDFTFVENALIYIDRQYIAENNTFKTVELPKTDSNGQTVGHFVRNDVLYNIRVIKDGTVLGNFKNQIAFCEDYTIGSCEMILEAVPEDLITFDYDEQLGIIFQTLPIYNEDTSSISFDFSTNDGSIKTVLMNVTRDDIFGNRSICNNTLTSSSGTLVCSVDPNIDDSVLRVGVSVDGQPIVLSSVRLESSDYGNLGYVLWFFLTFLFVLLFGHSKTEVLIGLAISFIGAISLGITRGDIIGLGSAGIWVLLIIILGIVKLNKDKPQ